MGAARIMVIDDEKIVVNMTKMHLVKEGFEVRRFSPPHRRWSGSRRSASTWSSPTSR